MRRDSVGEQDLEDAEPEHVREAPLEPLHRPLRDLLERRVERAAALHGAEREVHRERAVARVHLRLLGLARERAVGVGVLVEDARDHAQGERAGVAHALVTAGSAPRQAAQPVGCGHAAAARRLHVAQLQRTVAAAQDERAAVELEGARRRARRSRTAVRQIV